MQAQEPEQTKPTPVVEATSPAATANTPEAAKVSSTAITAEMPVIEEPTANPGTAAAPKADAAEPAPATPAKPQPATVSKATEPAKAEAAIKASKASAKSTPVGDDAVVLTTKSSKEQTVLALMDEVSSECVLTVALTPDLFNNGKFIGQKSAVVKAALKQGKQDALTQLRQAAHDLDANMVTDVAVKNSMKMVSTESAKIIVTATGNAIVAELYEEAYEA
ncbi:MAG TPA: heavy metal-binding domain-containing protein [Marinagarivorans sp.]